MSPFSPQLFGREGARMTAHVNALQDMHMKVQKRHLLEMRFTTSKSTVKADSDPESEPS